jgi:hypothetical protein
MKLQNIYIKQKEESIIISKAKKSYLMRFKNKSYMLLSLSLNRLLQRIAIRLSTSKNMYLHAWSC